MALGIWRRHRSTCKHRDDRAYKKCRCAVWCEGTVEGHYVRESLKTRSWDRGLELAREREQKSAKLPVTFREAADLFIAEAKSRNLQPVSLRKLELLVETFQKFAEPKYLKDITPATIIKFRASWEKDAPITQQKKFERLRAMFRWFLDLGFIDRTPMAGMKVGIKHETAVEPFSVDEQKKILETAYRFAGTRLSPKQTPIHPKTGTFAKLLLHSALRITDAAMLTKDRIKGGRIFLYATKNKKPVTLPLPPDLVAELSAIEGHGLFASPLGSARGETVSDYWRDQLAKVFTAAGIEGGHPHRFRHSVAVNMLDAGSSVEDVALVLGNSPAIVSKYYAAFVRSRQDRIDREIQKSWAVKKLVRVK